MVAKAEAVYGVRYKVEYWGKPREKGKYRRVADKILVSEDHDYGYADEVFVASIIKDNAGEWRSVLLVSSEGNAGGVPSRKMLEMVRDQIEHYLKHH